MKVLLAFFLSIFLTGCIAYAPVRYVVDEVCQSSDSRKAVLAEEVDAATYPHKVRIQCAKPGAKVTGAVE